MTERISLRQKLFNAFRIDRSIRLVWQASPKWTAINLAIIFIQGLLPLLLLYLMKLIIDTISSALSFPDPLVALGEIALLITLAGLAYLVNSAASSLSTYASNVQSITVRDHIYNRIHEKSAEVDLAYYENPTYFDTLHRAQLEGPYRPQRILNGLVQVCQNAISFMAMIGLLFLFHWSIAILLFIAALPGVVVRLVYAKKEDNWQREHTAEQRKASYLNWILTSEECAKEVRLYDTGNFFTQTFDKIREIIRRKQLTLARQRTYAESASGFFAIIILIGCFLMIAQRTLAGSITLGDMVMYYQAFQRGLNNLQTLLKNAASLYEDNLFVAYLFNFLAITNTVSDPPSPQRIPQNIRGVEIRLEHVSFSYPGVRESVLDDVNITIGNGETVALVGVNGAGKSTIVKLLCRLYDPKVGRLTFNGIDFRDLTQAQLRKQISTVFQDFVKYHLTVKENIFLGEATSAAQIRCIEEAAQKAGADSLISSLPNGYDTLLGRRFEAGEELSLGEWQKIALSRAFQRDTPLIILDEPASSLDPLAEYQMFSNFKKLIAGRSALLISHRLSAVRMADRIYLLSSGKISESGTHSELMALGGEYADMYSKQSGLFTMQK